MNIAAQPDGNEMDLNWTRTLDRGALASFCIRHHVRRLAALESYPLNGRETHDMLVEFEPGQSPDKYRLVGIEIELSNMAGRRVDLRTYDELRGRAPRGALENATVLFPR